MERLSKEKNIHLAFEISLFLKGLFAVGQIIGGIIAFFVTKEFLLKAASILTQEELLEDPRDLLANFLLHSAQNLSISTQHFMTLYLLAHGSIKLWLIIGLLREKLWYYSTAMSSLASSSFISCTASPSHILCGSCWLLQSMSSSSR